MEVDTWKDTLCQQFMMLVYVGGWIKENQGPRWMPSHLFSDQKLIHDFFNHPSSDGLPQHGGTIPRVVLTPRHLVMVMVSTMNWSCVCASLYKL